MCVLERHHSWCVSRKTSHSCGWFYVILIIGGHFAFLFFFEIERVRPVLVVTLGTRRSLRTTGGVSFLLMKLRTSRSFTFNYLIIWTFWFGYLISLFVSQLLLIFKLMCSLIGKRVFAVTKPHAKLTLNPLAKEQASSEYKQPHRHAFDDAPTRLHEWNTKLVGV